MTLFVVINHVWYRVEEALDRVMECPKCGYVEEKAMPYAEIKACPIGTKLR
jgi:hypothetical protein